MFTDRTPAEERIYLTGIDPVEGPYSALPLRVSDLAECLQTHVDLSVPVIAASIPRSLPLPDGIEDLIERGWAVVLPSSFPPEFVSALTPLIHHRTRQVPPCRLKILDYHPGEQIHVWYRRHNISPGNFDPEIVPYYLLLVGPPTDIPFEFQYLLGIEYAVGRICFDDIAGYDRYARSVVEYETAHSVPNAREIRYWGTRHPGDPATELSASLLVSPLVAGVPGAAGALKRPVHTDVGFAVRSFEAEDATRANLLESLCVPQPPAMLFTASHGLVRKASHPAQAADQGALLCQDWPGYGVVKPEHYLSALGVPDDARVHGMVAFLFACFGAGTPDRDQFLMDLSKAATAPLLAKEPFISALPKRLLAHPNGGALGVIGHIDRAWGFSIRPEKYTGAQIAPFRKSIAMILNGYPLGCAISSQFGQRYAALSTLLLSALAPNAPSSMRLSDRELVMRWIERNDAQNYVLLGDPAARVRTSLLK